MKTWKDLDARRLKVKILKTNFMKIAGFGKTESSGEMAVCEKVLHSV